MELINSFIEKYAQNLDLYQKASKYCAEICEKELDRVGVRAIVSYRAKHPFKLKEKLIKRSNFRQYHDFKDINNDIVDLAGVRISLYFPDDQLEIEKILQKHFHVSEIKRFPKEQEYKNNSNNIKYQKSFSGYKATHYRIHFKTNKLPENDSKYQNVLLEIQVASVLMHAWAEVEHDLIYKPASGDVSNAEYEILDELNGLVLSGEIALKRLQTAYKERVSDHQQYFLNHYELAAFLYNTLVSQKQFNSETLIMGRADRLFKFLKETNLNKPSILMHYVNQVHSNTKESTVVQQITDYILFEQPKLYLDYIKVKINTLGHNPYSNSSNISIENIDQVNLIELINILIELEIKNNIFTRSISELVSNKISENHETINYINYLTEIRNKLIHNKNLPTNEDLDYALIAAHKLLSYTFNSQSN